MADRTLLMLRGLPGAGKTRWAIEFLNSDEGKGWRRVNKDELRQMLWGNPRPKGKEKILDVIQDQIILELLAAGFDVIVDNTHLSPKRETHLRELVAGGRISVDVEVKTFNTPVWRCIINDAARPNPVGEKVIGRMYEQYMRPKLVEYDDSLPYAYIVDIDGTVANNEDRSPYDYDRVSSDSPNTDVINVIQGITNGPWTGSPRALFVSGRPDSCREDTETWLDAWDLQGALFMRQAGDNRVDAVVKREIYEQYIKGKYNILGVFDDRMQVVQMWRELGLTVFHVGYGFF